ncbi:acid protease [Sparassis latifolia]
MFLSSSLLLYLSLLLDDLAVRAVRIPISGKQVHRGWWEALTRRTSLSQGANVVDSSDVKYFANLTLGGSPFQVLIDTGSSDLWVAGGIANTQNTGKKASVAYAIGDATGPILAAQLEFDGYTVENQAFISVPVDDSHPTGQGIIGLGPNSGSQVHAAFNNASGDAVLDNIFRQNTSTPNYMTVLLGRSVDVANPYPGELTIGSVISSYENITSQPKLPVSRVSDTVGQHWLALLDKDGVVGPDGQPIEVSSTVGGRDQLTVMFDTGFTLPQVPPAVAGAIYGRVPGAKFANFTNTGPVWTVPCDVELNVTFKFGNVSFPINPLDTNLDTLNEQNANGSTICVGSFQPITTASSSNYDMILGMAFLRNAYMLINLGDFVDGSTSQTAPPYIQLLPTLDVPQGHAAFVKERLGGVDNTSSFHLLPAQPMDKGAHGSSGASVIKRYLPYIIAGSVVLGVLLIAFVWYCIASNRGKHMYQRLREPVEPVPVGVYQEQPPFTRYQQPHRRH